MQTTAPEVSPGIEADDTDGAEPDVAAASPAATGLGRRLGAFGRVHRETAGVLAAGLALTVVLVVASRVAYERTETRLLVQRTREAAAVLNVAVPRIETSLASAAAVEDELQGSDHRAFQRTMAPLVGEGQPFVSASVWAIGQPVAEATVGAAPKLLGLPAAERDAYLSGASQRKGMSVVGLLDGDTPRLGYAFPSSRSPAAYVVYAEAPLPPNRTALVRSDAAFSGLDNAVYLGDTESPDTLLTASTADLPLRGRRATETIRFGDTDLLLVMSPAGQLSGDLLARLSWLVALVGLTASLGGASLVERLLRRRELAEFLAAENERLYMDQMSVSLTLQRSLLPRELPAFDGVEVAARYVPGTEGLDIGGDWYDVIDTGGGSLFVVVGDVSGRGLEAGTLMASLRYSIRAFVSEGRGPAEVLAATTRLIDIDRDGHFATVLCASIDAGRRTALVVNAGHPDPVLIEQGEARFVATRRGPPLGLGPHTYEATPLQVPAGGTLLVYTDGLYERRDEPVTTSLERLRTSAASARGSLDDTLDGLVEAQLGGSTAFDDTALLGLRWTRPDL